jgi:NAD(P)-dependent dehydrogenase (short-subunit alcohol dehydrogenase family)
VTASHSSASPFRADVLEGQVAFVTGGATGIGKEICRVLGSHGARIAIASRKRDKLEEAAQELARDGVAVHFDVCDVRDAEAVQGVVTRIVQRFGRLDILVNNAAGNFPSLIKDISPNGFKAVVDIDLRGTYNVSRACFEAWLESNGGTIVNITAPFEMKGAALQAHVAAAKAGVDSLTRTCAVEWGRYNIRVNAIAPGTIEGTEGVRRFAEAVPSAAARSGNPLGMIGQGADIAYMVLFLATPVARFISGQVIAVDGAGSADLLKLNLKKLSVKGAANATS